MDLAQTDDDVPISDAELYKAHVLNLRAVEDGIAQIERDLNRAISEGSVSLSETLKKLYLFLAGAWAECRLKKLLYEANGFTEIERSQIKSQRTQSDKWKKSLELGYRKRYNVRRVVLSATSLPATAWFRYSALRELICQDLEPLIELRNTLAHGQWMRPLNSAETDISGRIRGNISRENALSIKFKLSLVNSLSNLIHDLVSARSFERDFDLHYGHIMSTRTNLERRSYETWKQAMIKKHMRGRAKRDAAIKAIGA